MSEPTMTPTEAAALVEADKHRRVQAAAEAVAAALEEYQCNLVALPQIAPDGRVVAVVQLAAR